MNVVNIDVAKEIVGGGMNPIEGLVKGMMMGYQGGITTLGLIGGLGGALLGGLMGFFGAIFGTLR